MLNELKKQYSDNYIVRKNGTLLLSPGKIPNSRHMLFKPLSNEYVEEYLVKQYRNDFPIDYINFLKYSNGANLNTIRLKTTKVSFAHPLFVIFGLPLTPPFNRPFDMEEPFDIRIEDLARHNEIPKTWLKCGTYTHNYNFKEQTDIFVDTETNKVYACIKNQKEIVDSWDNLDECFCSILDSFANSKLEYEYQP